MSIRTLLARFAADESGATMIEYGFILALVAVGLIVLLTGIGETVTGFFTDAGAGLT